MMGYEKALTGAERVAKRRSALRAQGLKPRTFWLPDTATVAFQEKADRSRDWLWDRVPNEVQSIAWIEAMTDELLTDLDRAEEEQLGGHAE